VKGVAKGGAKGVAVKNRDGVRDFLKNPESSGISQNLLVLWN